MFVGALHHRAHVRALHGVQLFHKLKRQQHADAAKPTGASLLVFHQADNAHLCFRRRNCEAHAEFVIGREIGGALIGSGNHRLALRIPQRHFLADQVLRLNLALFGQFLGEVHVQDHFGGGFA